MGEVCSTQKCAQNLVGKPKWKRPFKDVSGDRRIILKRIRETVFRDVTGFIFLSIGTGGGLL
jgi:hypothetical protein